ncbi:nitrate ABC transporter substrate-binding protein [Haloarcula sp. CBA1130]|uniref:ABC transporter substrate-binding protein n=1 Tax=unclassified Haloarcula TaxID=2624677 RepID=UPI00124768AD|nr:MULTISPECIES: ABC transporter substrate-binding protein [unclassified Haloarcula]KAA9396607.1 nitrate ABC transporter substrate-binding protein [Haloarcula sp. CBA1130]KAA9397770.1 nitrate ABC transporter substrate-binding protein [Haloarcula sp. CBA1129]
MTHTSRRKLLQKASTTTVAAVGIAGCLGRGSDPLDSVTIAYVPIYPNMQHYVMEQEGYYEDVPADVTIDRFSSGPSVVKAFANGDVDVALFGISPAMLLVDKGTDAGILAANSRNGFKIVGTTELADLYEQEGAAAFEHFEQEHGRKVQIGAPPDGSVPDIVLRYWLQDDLAVGKMESVVNKSKVPPAKAVQTIRAGDIDATIIQEPFATIIDREDGFSELAWSGSILENHPVTVLFANQQVLDDSEVTQALVEQHVAATEFIESSPDTAAAHAASVIGSGVSEDLATAAMDSKASEFISNPHAVSKQAATMGEFASNAGNIEEPIATETLFAFESYDASQK